VAGGSSGSGLDVMELFNPNTQTSCVITDRLDQPRFHHTGDGNLVCGGWGKDGDRTSSCYNVATGDTINLLNVRSSHTSWATDAGIYLLGGWDGSGYNTTELVTEDTTQAGFGLQYWIESACGIADDSSHIITGGYLTWTTVSRYSQTGWMEDLPSLSTWRYHHGCGTYVDTDSQRIYLVTGGWSDGYISLSSTEQLMKGGTEWILTENSLPASMHGLGTISFNNQIFTTGGGIYLDNQTFTTGGHYQDTGAYSDKILLFDPDTKTFNNIGKLEQRRMEQSVSVVDINDFTCSNADTKPFTVLLGSVFLILIYLL